ncbi:MAG: alpha/beta hydrolase [Dehalococcoidia bacterium]
MPVHPQARAILDMMATMMPAPMHTLSPQEARAMAFPPPEHPEAVHEVTNRTIPGPAGEIPVRVYRPSAATGLPALVWYHGGGWVIGNLDGSDATGRSLANQAGCVVLSVDYRLAPEARFPAAVDDAYAAALWVAEHGSEIGADGTRIAVGGDSAGGNLAAAVALMARDRGGPRIVQQSLIYPVTDHAYATPSYAQNADGYLLTKDMMVWFWDHYLGPQGDGANPYASPARASSLAHLPPALVITAEFDPLRDEGEAFGQALRAAGVQTTCTRYDGMIHGFFGMAGVIDCATDAQAETVKHLRAAFGN